MKESEDIAKNLLETIGTMKIMIYSLKQAVDDILVAFGGNEKDLVDTTKWEKQCKKTAKEVYSTTTKGNDNNE